MRKGKAKRVLRKLNYLPRWAWYALSFFVGGGPFGLIFVYLVFHVLEKAAQEEDEDYADFADYTWNVNIDGDGVHVSRRSASEARSTGATYEDEDCVVTDDEEVARAWERAQASADRVATQAAGRAGATGRAADSAHTASDEGGAGMSADASVADVIREGRDAIQRLRRADEIIADPELSAQIVSIEESCAQILSILEQRPQVLPQLRTFLRYYLPTTLKLLEARSRLENRANTPKAKAVCARISEAIGAVDKAFKKQVEALDEYRFIDLESEMDVLRDMLKADGLVDEEREADPFADVLASRRAGGQDKEQAGGTPMATH